MYKGVLWMGLGLHVLWGVPAQAHPLDLFCPAGSRFETDSEYDAEDAETNVWLLCTNAEGKVVKDVTGPVVLTGVALVVSVVLAIMGVTVFKTLKQTKKLISHLPKEQGKIWVNIDKIAHMSSDSPSLKHRLKELEDAYAEGLLSEAEYQQKRQQLLEQL